MVNLFGKKIARIISSVFGVVIVFYSILGLTETFNSKSEIRYKNTEPTQRMEYLKNQNNKWNTYLLDKELVYPFI